MDWIKRKGKNRKLELVRPTEYPQFTNVVDCIYKNILCKDKKWYIITLTLDKKKGVPVSINEARIETIETMVQSIEHNIVIGNLRAQIVDDHDAKEGYYVFEWIGVTYTDQEIGELVFDTNYLYTAKQSSSW